MKPQYWNVVPGPALFLFMLCLIALPHAARAQFPDSLGDTAGTTTVTATGKRVLVQSTFLSISPVTVFQFKNNERNASTGNTNANQTTNSGPFIQIEKNYSLKPNAPGQASSFALGTWYWYSGSRLNNDRFGLYGQYTYASPTRRKFGIGGQFTLGGALQGNSQGSESGFFEYYGFLLVQPPLFRKSRVGLQAGIGPYIPRSSVGNVGYTYTIGGVYKLTNRFNLSASYWSVNYKVPSQKFGTSFTSNLKRYNVSLVYGFR